MKHTCWSVLFLALLGCDSGKSAYRGPSGQVTGKITLNGHVLPPGCRVVFQAVGANHSPGAEISSSGEFRLSHSGSYQIPVGTYKVQLAPPIVANVGSDPARPRTLPPPPFPNKYMYAESSGIEFTVAAGSNVAKIDLKSE